MIIFWHPGRRRFRKPILTPFSRSNLTQLSDTTRHVVAPGVEVDVDQPLDLEFQTRRHTLGELEPLEKEYKRIGDFLKQRCAGYTAYILVGNKELSVKIGLKASRRMVFYNGNIECRLLKYELYKGTRQLPNSGQG